MRRPYLIVPIVEGHGDATAVPAMVNRWLSKRGFRNFRVAELGVRAAGASALKVASDPERELGIEHYVRYALAADPDAILVLLDADDECLQRRGREGLGPELLRRAKIVACDVPVAVVVANREFEAWFLADYQSLRAQGLFLPGVTVSTDNLESLPGCKTRISLQIGKRYKETTHQAELAACMSFGKGAMRYSASYRRLEHNLDNLTREARKRRRTSVTCA